MRARAGRRPLRCVLCNDHGEGLSAAIRAQIDRIAKQIEALGAVGPRLLNVPMYDGETEAEALALYRDEFNIDASDARRVAFNRARRGETREDCKESGLHILYSIAPDTLDEVLAEIDGCNRGIPQERKI